MRSIALIVSAEIDFRGKVKSILAGFDSDLEFRLASDEKIGLGRLQEEDHQIVIVDDDSVKNFFEEKCSSLKVSSKSCFIKVRTGGRRSVRLRQSPFAYTEVIIENASKLDELKTDILQAVAAAAGHKGRRSEAALKDAKAPQAPQSEKVRQVDSSQGRMASESTLALPPEFSEPVRKVNPEMFLPEIIVIGSSTGGPEALERFFTSVDYNFIVPVVVVQHMPAGFTKGLVRVKFTR